MSPNFPHNEEAANLDDSNCIEEYIKLNYRDDLPFPWLVKKYLFVFLEKDDHVLLMIFVEITTASCSTGGLDGRKAERLRTLQRLINSKVSTRMVQGMVQVIIVAGTLRTLMYKQRPLCDMVHSSS